MQNSRSLKEAFHSQRNNIERFKIQFNNHESIYGWSSKLYTQLEQLWN